MATEDDDKKSTATAELPIFQNVLSSSGPKVKCVILRHIRKTGRDVKPHPASPKHDDKHKREVLTELIDEVIVDTTPSKSEVKKLLGGTLTFIGQYPDEGTMVMAPAELPDSLDGLSIKALRELCEDRKIDTTSMVEKSELVSALLDTLPPVNPHKLQPPLDGIVVRGDILLLRVAETEEELDNDKKEEKEEGDSETKTEEKVPKELSNEEFFLDYTKEEYIAFASRTDVVAPQIPVNEEEEDEEIEDESEGEEEEEEDDEEEDVDDDYNPEEDDEEDRRALLNLLMSEVLKKFREENGRGPDSRELLELRGQVASKLGVEVATLEDMEQIAEESERTQKKRAAEDQGEHSSPKKVKFTAETIANDVEEAKGEDESNVENNDDSK